MKIYFQYTQAQVAFVPNAIFDILIYNNKKNITSLSLKTTLRERWKQADLEAFALKNVHRNSNIFLITLSEREAKTIKSKIQDGGVLGLDDVIMANSNEFNMLINNLKKELYVKPGKIDILESFNEISN